MSKKVEPGRVDPRSTAATAGLENSLVGMSGFRAEPPHVAQQSRRDKLRVQPIPVASIPDHLLVRDVYDPALFSSSSMLDFSAQEASSFVANPSTSNFHDGNTSLWKGLGSQPTCDWITSCVGVGGVAPIQSPLFPSHLYPLKPGISGYQDVPSGDLSGQGAQKQYGDLHFASPSFCHNALEEAVTSSSPSVGHQGIEISPLVQPNIREVSQPWVDSASELLLLPSYGNQVSTTRLESTAVWLSRQPQQWNSEEAFARHKNDGGLGAIASDGTTQGLALSLSSNPLPELQVAQFEERFGHEDFTTRANIVQDLHTSRVNDVGISTSYPKFAVSDRGYGNSTEGVVGSSMDARRGAGPLGPFTGYATILKSSKFLRPAQQLLDEFCSVVTGLKLAKQCNVPERSSGVVSATCDAPVAENGFGARGGNSGGSSSSFYSSTEATGQGGAGNVASPIQRPEFQQKKAKLLYMQEEVCRRYKQYHQQMQMVISSFESVSGLSAATPYTSLALKAVSKHFRCLRNAISDQVRHISKMLGEEFMSFPGSDTTGNAMTAPRLKFVEQSLRKQKTGDRGSSFLDHAQPVWRPQRGLPERSVAVLRAWLFEHFLHPYPTDTDKHMLASQTGLSRNQVSNWFINARVRLWKPMVEEIHMLETKGLTEMDLNSANKNDGKLSNPSNNGGQPSSHQRSEAQCCKPSDCTSMGTVPNNESYQTSIVQWQQKRSRMEDCMVPEGVDGGLMSFAYEGGMDLGGLGAVSLTLGLQHNEGASMVHQQQQQQQMRRHFGGQMVHDFVG